MTLAELRLRYYVPWRNWQLTFHFTGFSLNWTSLELILLNSYVGSVFTQRIGISHLAFQPLFCLSTFLVLRTGKTEFYVVVLGVPRGAHQTLSLSQSFFFFLSKDRETNSMLFLLASIDSFLVYRCFCSLFSVFR